MAAGSSLKYHAEMGDSRGELYELLAEAQALLQSLRLQGVISVPVGERQTVPRAEAAPARVGGAFAGSVPPRPAVSPTAQATSSTTPRPVTALPTLRPVAAPPPRPAVAPMPRPAVAPPPRPPVAPEPPSSAAGGLLGQWGARLVPVQERLARVVSELGASCEACGQPTLTGTGGLNSNLVLFAAPADGESGVMLANMLVKVVLIEPADAWWVVPRGCQACDEGVARQVAAIRPRVVLALGAQAGVMLGDPPVGAWTRYGQTDAVRTWHPDEILLEPSRKRIVFGHLQEVARRR